MLRTNGLWLGGLVLTLLGAGAEPVSERSPWRAVERVPEAEAPGFSLGSPVPLPQETPRELPVSDAPSSGIIPASYEVAQPALQPPPAVLPTGPMPSIIAVGATMPLATPEPLPSPPAGEPDDSESQFAVERPNRPTGPRPPPSPLVLASAVYGQWNVPPMELPPAGDDAAPALSYTDPLRSRFYLSGEYLLWWLQGDRIPVLATTSAAGDFGILGAPTTTTLFGGNAVNTSPFSGGRFTIGYWLDCWDEEALEVSGFFLGPRAANFTTNSFTHPVIGRPFLELNSGAPSSQLTALPGVATGALTIHAPTFLWGAESNFRFMLCHGCNFRIAGLAGFRNLNLDENISVTESLQGLSTAPPPFTDQGITVFDRFATQNHFYGGQLGADLRWYAGRFSLDVRGKVALGGTVQQLDIAGNQQFVSPQGVVQNYTGGLLALNSNIGNFTHSVFSVVPEVWCNLGYQFTPYLRGFVGYNFLYWSNVIRPGTSIDTGLDLTRIPNFPLAPQPSPLPGLHPAANFREIGLWVQGINFGLEFTY